MVIEKAPPSLRRWLAMANHVLGNGGLGGGYAKLYKLAVHAGSSPKRIGAAHVADQLAYSGRDGWASGTTSPTLPCPIAPEPGAVPPDDRFGFHDDEDPFPIGPDSAQEHPETAVDIREPRTFHRTMEDGELLPKSEILQSQLATSLERRDQRANTRPNHCLDVEPPRTKDQARRARMNKWKGQAADFDEAAERYWIEMFVSDSRRSMACSMERRLFLVG